MSTQQKNWMPSAGIETHQHGWTVFIRLTRQRKAYVAAGVTREMAENISSDIQRALLDAFDVGYEFGREAQK